MMNQIGTLEMLCWQTDGREAAGRLRDVATGYILVDDSLEQ